MPHRRLLPVLASCLLLAASSTAPSARALVREDFPAQALALLADANADGVVTREEIADACAKAVADAPAQFERDWRAKLGVYGMPADAKALDVERIFAATVAIVDGADADGDGRVTPAELKAYVERFDAERRPDMIQSALALDRNVDLVVSRAEVAAAKERFATEIARIKELSPHVREAMLHPTKAEGLEAWKASTNRIADGAIVLWREIAGTTGKASLGDIRAHVPEPAEADASEAAKKP
jgi:hypothetical protein